MKVGYAVLYEDGELVISKNHTLLPKPILKDYGEFEDTNVPWAWCDDYFAIKQVRILNQVKSNCMNKWFAYCEDLTTSINMENIDVSDCIDFSYLFFKCKSLGNISFLKDWNVFNGKNFEGIFYGCESLMNCVDLQKWNLSNGNNFFRMFKDCITLKEIYLQNTINKLKFKMFDGCNPKLKIYWKDKIYTYEDLIEYKEL